MVVILAATVKFKVQFYTSFLLSSIDLLLVYQRRCSLHLISAATFHSRGSSTCKRGEPRDAPSPGPNTAGAE